MRVTLPVDGSKSKGFKPEEVAIGDWTEDLPVPLAHKKRPTESLLFLVKIAFVLNTPGNVRAIGTFTEDSGLGDVEEYQSPPARGTVPC